MDLAFEATRLNVWGGSEAEASNAAMHENKRTRVRRPGRNRPPSYRDTLLFTFQQR
jgi:hypothetical protein